MLHQTTLTIEYLLGALIGVSRPGYLGTPLASGRSAEAQADLLAALIDGLVLVSTVGGKVDTALPLSFYLLKFLSRFDWFGRRLRRQVLADPDKAARPSIPPQKINLVSESLLAQ